MVLTSESPITCEYDTEPYCYTVFSEMLLFKARNCRTPRLKVSSEFLSCNGQQVPTHISCLFLSIFFLLRTCLAYFRLPRDLHASFLHYSLLFQIGQSFLLQPLSSQTLIFETSVHIIIVYNATLHVLRYSYLQHRLLPTLSRVLLPSSSSLVLQALALVYRLLEP